MDFPRVFRLKQTFHGPVLIDIPGAVREALRAIPLPIRPGQSVALAVGSRGIANLAAIVRAVVDEVTSRGARPFIFPAMGSHGGGTAEGQASVLAHYGITQASMGCPIRATMEVAQVGEALGLPVWLDREAAGADWIGVINRVKPHTDFKGSIESGLFKMMAIGMAKRVGAAQAHRASVRHRYETVITAVGREVLQRARIAFGLGIVENAYEQTAKVQAFLPEALEAGERVLLAEARAWMARLPFDPIDVLIVDEMGKNISGTGMDTNVIGRGASRFEPFPDTPRITWIVPLGLTPETYGNANGIGNADFTTRRLAEKIDWEATLINCLAAVAPNMAKLPPVFETDREAIAAALDCLGRLRPDEVRVVRIKNTLMLGEVEASEAFLPELAARDDLVKVTDPAPLFFDETGTFTPF